MTRLILAAVAIALLLGLLLWRRIARKPAQPAATVPPPELERPVSAEQEHAPLRPAEPAQETFPVEILPPEQKTEHDSRVVSVEPAPYATVESEAPVADPMPPPEFEEVAPTVASRFEDVPIPVDEPVPIAPETAEEPADADQPLFVPAGDQPASASPPETATATTASGASNLPLENYRLRLNDLEERQRVVLAQAVQKGDDKERDRLQRELVIMNERLALIEDSHAEELFCLDEALATLEQLREEHDEEALTVALDHLRRGEARRAEEYLIRMGQGSHPLAARMAYQGGRLAACRVDLQQALALFRRALALEPENLAYLQAAGKTARDLYNYREALPWQKAQVRLATARSEADPLDKALAQRDLAYTYVLSGQHQKAGPLYKEAMTAIARLLGQDHPEMATCWQQIGELQETLGEYDKAVSLYTKALNILERKRGPEHPALAAILDKLAALCMELEMEKQAVPLYERLVGIRKQALRPNHPQLVKSLGDLAESYRLQGRYAEAEACYLQSLAINESVHGQDHPRVAAVLQELAKLCGSQRKKEEAEQYQQRAAAIFRQSVEAAERRDGGQPLTLEL